jgi:hypothetical protein
MRRPLTISVISTVAFAVLVLGAVVEAHSESRQSAAVSFVERKPGVATALAVDIDYVNPADPGAKPPAVRTIVLQLAEGARFDTSVPQRCAAPDPVLIVQGASACPAASRVGAGFLRIDTGLPSVARFLEQDITFLNAEDELIFLFTNRQTGARLVSRAAINGGTATTNAPPLPGTPPDGGAIDVVRERLNAMPGSTGSHRGYVTTPPTCPSSGAWTNSIRFTYADGVSQMVKTRSPCSAAAGYPTKG